MKQLAIAWILLVALAFALAGSCAIEHRSGAFECVKTSDCDPPRVCSDSLCIVPAGVIDAPPGDGQDGMIFDGPKCPDGCTSCDPGRMTCTIDCAAANSACNQPVTCPKNWNCLIKCSTTDACRSGVNCQNAESCDLECTGFRACRNVSCPAGRCLVNCTGSQSCNTILCNQSCACDVKCPVGTNGCLSVSCSVAPQCDIGAGCSSLVPGCDVCP